MAKAKGRHSKKAPRGARRPPMMMPEGSPGEEAGESPAMEAQEQAQGTEMPQGMARGGKVKGGGEHNPGMRRMHNVYAETGQVPGMKAGGRAKGGKC